MAARQRGDECLFRIDGLRIGIGRGDDMGRRRRRYLRPAIERPDMCTAVAMVRRGGIVSLPANIYAVHLGAILYSGAAETFAASYRVANCGMRAFAELR